MSEETQPPGPEGPAERLAALKDAILSRWKQRARRELPAAGGQEGPALLDMLPEVIDTMAEALRQPEPLELIEARGHVLGVEHGRQRARLEGYSLEQVIDEYQIFRRVLFEALEEDREPLEARPRDALLAAIHGCVRNAACAFSLSRSAEQELAAATLSDLNRQLDALVTARTAQLTHSEELFRHLVEGVKDYAIVTLDPAGHITTWNQGAERMKGYSPQEAIGAHFSMLYPQGGKRRDEPNAHLRAAESEGRFRGEGLRVRKNGDLFAADVCITPIHEGGKLVGFSKVVQDLTERNLLLQEQDLSRIDVDQLKAEGMARQRFMATLTHDLRSPLSAAATAAELIARAPDQEDKVRTMAGRVLDAVKRADKMIADLLDASRLQAGQPLPLTFAPCDGEELAREVCDELATQHGRRFKIRVEGEARGTWSCGGIRRVLENLLSNAVKYSDTGTMITVRLARVEDRVLLSVHNEGTLIPREEQAKLFKPFHRTPTAAASGKVGWGIGLTLVKGIADAHGGIVKVESYPTAGTKFTVDLPVEAPARQRQDGAP